MKFNIKPDILTIKLEGTEKLWAIKSKLKIPRSAISDVDFMPQAPVMRDLEGYIRLPGSIIPPYFAAGSYRRKDEREFWYLKFRSPGVMTLFLKPGEFDYDKIRLTTTPEIAQQIADWWRTEQ